MPKQYTDGSDEYSAGASGPSTWDSHHTTVDKGPSAYNTHHTDTKPFVHGSHDSHYYRSFSPVSKPKSYVSEKTLNIGGLVYYGVYIFLSGKVPTSVPSICRKSEPSITAPTVLPSVIQAQPSRSTSIFSKISEGMSRIGSFFRSVGPNPASDKSAVSSEVRHSSSSYAAVVSLPGFEKRSESVTEKLEPSKGKLELPGSGFSPATSLSNDVQQNSYDVMESEGDSPSFVMMK